MNLRLPWTVLLGVLVSMAGTASAQQPGFSSANLPLVMTAYVEAVVDMHAAYETCAPADKRPAEWERGSALLIESLRAAGLSESVAGGLQARLAAPVVRFVGDCAGEQFMFYSGMPVGQSWPDYHRDVLGRNGIKIVEPGVNDARLSAAHAVVMEALPRQKRMLVCISLFNPQGFLAVFSEWNGLVANAAQAFISAGFGPSDYSSILDGALASVLFVPPADRRATAADCLAQQDWMERYGNFSWYAFASDVEAALKGEATK